MKIKHLILAFGGASLLAACNLDEYPYGFYSEDNFYKTEADAESAVNYIYDAINYIEYSRSIVFLGDMNTDDMEPKGDAAAANKELDGWKINNFKTNTTLGNFYKYSYITINRANAVIKKVPGMNIDEGRRNRFLGEAYFMRAYSYFNLARNFGCVPVHTTPVETLEDTAVPAAESLDPCGSSSSRTSRPPVRCCRSSRRPKRAVRTAPRPTECWPRLISTSRRPRSTACPSTPPCRTTWTNTMPRR